MAKYGHPGTADTDEILDALSSASHKVKYALAIAKMAETKPTTGLLWRLTTADKAIIDAHNEWTKGQT